jgi:hypothetical protein
MARKRDFRGGGRPGDESMISVRKGPRVVPHPFSSKNKAEGLPGEPRGGSGRPPDPKIGKKSAKIGQQSAKIAPHRLK